METLYWIVWFWITWVILILLLQILNEKPEVQIFIGIISMWIGWLMQNLLWENTIASTLMLGWLSIMIVWFKIIPKRKYY